MESLQMRISNVFKGKKVCEISERKMKWIRNSKKESNSLEMWKENRKQTSDLKFRTKK